MGRPNTAASLDAASDTWSASPQRGGKGSSRRGKGGSKRTDPTDTAGTPWCENVNGLKLSDEIGWHNSSDTKANNSLKTHYKVVQKAGDLTTDVLTVMALAHLAQTGSAKEVSSTDNSSHDGSSDDGSSVSSDHAAAACFFRSFLGYLSSDDFCTELKEKQGWLFDARTGVTRTDVPGLFVRCPTDPNVNLAAECDASVAFRLKITAVTSYQQHVGETWFQLLCGYAAVEALFYLFFLRQKARFQKITPLPHRCSSRQERKKLIEQCIAAIRHPDEKLMLRNVREFLEGWFVGSKLEDISFEDFANWCSWAFFNLERKDLLPEDEAELEETIAWYSSQIHWVFPHTSSKERRFCTRLSLDPVQVKHRPFIAYVVTSLMMYSGLLSIRLLGFRKCHRRGVNNNSVDVHYRKGDPAAAKATCKSTLPIVFIHGIGIGFIHYAAFLRTLPTDVDVYLVEWPHVSMKLVFEGPSSISSTVTTLRDIVVGDGHGKTGACFVGHSLGSTAVAWMLHDKSSKSLVKSAVFLDPVNFVLFDPAIAYAFMHRPPNTVMQLLIHYFVSRELFIAHTLSRHFSWSHNALFLEDLK
eukprot:gene18223-28079_t